MQSAPVRLMPWSFMETRERIYTLQGADYAYRVMVESIHEGAANITANGDILYCNGHLAVMLAMPLESVLGTSFYNYLPPGEQEAFTLLITKVLMVMGELNSA